MTRKKTSPSPNRESACQAEILSHLLTLSPLIQDYTERAQGDARFFVKQADMKMPDGSRLPESVFESTYVIDLVGESLVRKNLLLFATMLSRMDPEIYVQSVSAYEHRHFGLQYLPRGQIQFEFHLSLIQRILTEDMDDLFNPIPQ